MHDYGLVTKVTFSSCLGSGLTSIYSAFLVSSLLASICVSFFISIGFASDGLSSLAF